MSASVRERARSPLDLVRAGLCVVMLLRHENFLRGWVDLEHHAWGSGPEFGSESLARLAPQFAAPLLPGLDALLPWSDALCRLRLGLTICLLIGVFPRINALLLALVSFALFAADGFHYLHHLLILYVSVLFLAFAHVGPAPTGTERPAPIPLALLVLRAHVLVVYTAAGLAKLNPSWLSGRTLTALHDTGFVSGALYDAGIRTVGAQHLALGACAAELLIPALLAFRRTRLLGGLFAVTLHASIHLTMLVATFGGTMLVLLLSFLPCTRERARPPAHTGGRALSGRAALAFAIAAASPLAAHALGTTVGSYTMFTRLVRYELTVTVDGAPFSREALAPHLGRDGARVLRLANGRGIGETTVSLLGKALPELGDFVCQVRPGARTVHLEFRTERIEGGEERWRKVTQACPAVRRAGSSVRPDFFCPDRHALPLREAWQELDEVTGLGRSVELRRQDLLDGQADRAGGAGKREHERLANESGEGARLDGGGADVCVGEHAKELAEAGDGLGDQGLDGFRRYVAPSDARAAGDQDDRNVLAPRPAADPLSEERDVVGQDGAIDELVARGLHVLHQEPTARVGVDRARVAHRQDRHPERGLRACGTATFS